MGQTSVVGSHKTAIYQENGMTKVKYHSTNVVSWDDEYIILDSGGWQTVTTKLRMNQASIQFGLPFGVYQKDFKWFVDFNGKTYPFSDGMKLTRPIA